MKQSNKKELTALFPGSFDPITRGHIDIIKRLSQTFASVTVLVAESSQKIQLFSAKERVEFAQKAVSLFKNVQVVSHQGLTVEYAKKKTPCILVRSMRGVSDFDYERTMSEANRLLASDIETYYIFSRPEYVGIASSLVKEIARHKGDTSKFVTLEVEKALLHRLAPKAIKK